jgi:hypothetical protein
MGESQRVTVCLAVLKKCLDADYGVDPGYGSLYMVHPFISFVIYFLKNKNSLVVK